MEFEHAMRLAEEDPRGALSLLKLTAQTHWGVHVEELARHLLWLSSSRRT